MKQGPPANKPYWDKDDPPFRVFNEKRIALIVGGLNVAQLDDEQRGRLFEVLADELPDGWHTYPRYVGGRNADAA
jgi:hypothetical protein